MTNKHHKDKQTPYDILRENALTLAKQVANLDAEIKELTDNRAKIQKELRAIKSKMITIELAKSLAA